MAAKKKSAKKKSTTTKPKRKASLEAMLKALEVEIEKQRFTVEMAQQRLTNLEEDRERLKEQIEECEEE